MASADDHSYQITGKVCPPKLPMESISTGNWNNIPPPLLQSLLTELPVQGAKSNSLCGLMSQANVLLSSQGHSHSSVVGIPYFFCNLCDHHTDSKATLLKHVASKHIFKCRLCDHAAFTRFDLVQHQLHKHLDAEEMQPVLNMKALHVNTSVLQRNLQNLSTNSRGNEVESIATVESVNSSESTEEENQNPREISGIISERGRYEKPQESSSNALSVVEDENPVTSSVRQGHHAEGSSRNQSDYLVISRTEHGSLLDTDTVPLGPKRRSTDSHPDDEERPLKRIRASSSMSRQSEEYTIEIVPDNAHSMPHFLDESDSSVTSSSGRPINKQSPSVEECEQKVQLLKAESDHSPMMSSFLTDPQVSSADSIENKTSAPRASTVRRILQKDDGNMCVDTNFVKIEMAEAPPTVISSTFQHCPSPRFSGSEERERERSLSPNLSLLSGERLQKQLEEAVSKSPGFSFLEASKEESDSSVVDNCGSFFENSDLVIHSVSSLSKSVDNPEASNNDTETGSSENVDHFLTAPEDCPQTELTKYEESMKYFLNDSDIETMSTMDSGDKYDILRKLLVGKGLTVATGSSDEKLEWKGRRKNKNTSPAPEPSPAVQVTRASDMSLRDLLTQGVPGVARAPSIISVVCGYCNFESHDREDFSKHVEKCKQIYPEQRKIEADTDSCHSKDLPHVKLEPPDQDDDVSIVKIEPPDEEEEETDGQQDGSASASAFRASEMLKGFTHHYHETVKASNDTRESENSPTAEVEKSSIKSVGETSHVGPRKLRCRKKRRNEDKAYIPDDEVSSESYSSDSDYAPNSSSSTKKKGKKKNKHQKKDVVESTMITPRRISTKRQPEFHLACLYCSFATTNRAEMRQHLIASHFSCASYAKALFQPRGEGILYFCKGVRSTCTFFSSEGLEIFEHIKLCYADHLDCYLDGIELPDYSNVLYSLGVASKLIDTKSVMFYCLRCKYSKSSLQSVMLHVSSNHPKNVAGILQVNKTLAEPRVHMLCLSCKVLVALKNWVSHPCRRKSGSCVHIDTGASSKSKSSLSEILKRSSPVAASSQIQYNKPNLEPNSETKDSSNIMKLKVKTGKPVEDHSAFHENVQTENVGSTDVEVKVMKVDDSEEEDDFDGPVHFSQDMDTNTQTHSYKSEASVKNRNARGMRELVNSQTRTRSVPQGSSVLQNLLTAPKGEEVAPKSFSLLHTLLKPSSTVSEGNADLHLSSPRAASSAKSQFTSLRNVLSGGETASRSTCAVISQSDVPTLVKQKRQNGGKTGSGHSEPSPASTKSGMSEAAPIFPPPSQTRSTAASQLLSSLYVSVQESSSHSQPELSPPLIPHPPQLPLLPPLSPSPPPAAAAAEDHGTPGPFTNLLRGLLTKSDPKPKS